MDEVQDYAWLARRALDGWDHVVAVLDVDGRIVLVNAAWTAVAAGLLGVHAGVGTDYLEVCASAAATEPTAALAAAAIRSVQDGVTAHATVDYECGVDDEPRWYRLHVTPLPGPGPAALLIVHEDVSDHQRNRAALQMRGRLLGSIGEAVLATDARGLLTYLNRAAERLFAVRSRSVLGHPLSSVLPMPQPRILSAPTPHGAPRDPHRIAATLARLDTDIEIQVTLSATTDVDDHVDGWIVVAVDVTERTGLQEQLRHHATHDELTGLPNRTGLRDRIEAVLEHDRAAGRMTAVLVMDLDSFQAVNDAYGHEGGDAVLASVGGILAALVTGDGVVARLGGDEFVLCVGDLPNAAAACAVADGILEALLHHHLGDLDVPCRASASIGVVALHPTADTDAAGLIGDADAALFHAKRLGRGRVELYDDDLGAQHRRRVALRRDLLVADDSQFEVRYQPLVRLSTGRIVAFEALLRWQHPAYGEVSPLEFIPIAEETGVIHALGRLVVARASARLAAWRALLPEADLGMAVNLSVAQLADPSLAEVVAEALATEDLPPTALCLEITESALMEDVVVAGDILRQLKSLGVLLAIDDFGTGYSSLAYLRHLPVDVLKIDREFIRMLDVNPEDAIIVAAISQLARNLNLRMVAEGVETAVQRDRVAALGCDWGQGYLWAPAMSADEVEARLRAGFVPWEAARPLDTATEGDQGPAGDVGIDEVVALLRHELGSPLQIIRLYADTLTKGVMPDGDHVLAAALGAISRSADDIQTLIRHLTDLRWIDTGALRLERTPTDVGRLIQALLDDLGMHPGGAESLHPLTLVVPERPVLCNIDPTRVRQIVTNLLTNTVRHTPVGTAVVVGVALVDRDLEITVADSGEGIPADKAPMLFRKFSRLVPNRPGTGLGLYLSRGLARAHGGDLCHRVTPGGGATFALTLPRSARTARQAASPPATQGSLRPGVLA